MSYLNFAIDNWLYILLALIIVPILIKRTVGCNINWHSWTLVSERDWDGIKKQVWECKKCKLTEGRESW